MNCLNSHKLQFEWIPAHVSLTVKPVFLSCMHCGFYSKCTEEDDNDLEIIFSLLRSLNK